MPSLNAAAAAIVGWRDGRGLREDGIAH
jgi:hypothetical protein